MRLPPLNAPTAFESAARLGGFVGASGELSVTPAAVSHHVKSVDAHLRVLLFRQLPQGLKLTEVDQELLP